MELISEEAERQKHYTDPLQTSGEIRSTCVQ